MFFFACFEIKKNSWGVLIFNVNLFKELKQANQYSPYSFRKHIKTFTEIGTAL